MAREKKNYNGKTLFISANNDVTLRELENETFLETGNIIGTNKVLRDVGKADIVLSIFTYQVCFVLPA